MLKSIKIINTVDANHQSNCNWR